MTKKKSPGLLGPGIRHSGEDNYFTIVIFSAAGS